MQVLVTHGALENTWAWKITALCTRAHTHTLSQELDCEALMKKVCACAFHERLHVWDETQPKGDALAPRRQNLILEDPNEVLYAAWRGEGPDESLF